MPENTTVTIVRAKTKVADLATSLATEVPDVEARLIAIERESGKGDDKGEEVAEARRKMLSLFGETMKKGEAFYMAIAAYKEACKATRDWMKKTEVLAEAWGIGTRTIRGYASHFEINVSDLPAGLLAQAGKQKIKLKAPKNAELAEELRRMCAGAVGSGRTPSQIPRDAISAVEQARADRANLPRLY